MRYIFSRALSGLAVIAALYAAPTAAHEGHDHGEQPAPPVANIAPRAESISELFELVAVASTNELLIYLDRFQSNEPVEDAVIEIETPAGPEKARAEAGGPYRLAAPWLKGPGRYDFIVTVTAGSDSDILPVTLNVPAMAASARPGGTGLFAGNRQALLIAGASFLAGVALGAIALRRRARASALMVFAAASILGGPARAHDGHDHAESAPQAPTASIQPSGERAQRLGDSSLFVPKPVQRIFGVRTVLTENATHQRSVELPGRIIPDPNASGYVQSGVGGRISPPAGGFPRLGTRVKQGDTLAYVTPPLQAIDVSDMRQRQGELDQQISIVVRRLARQEQLATSGTVSRVQLEETKLELEGLRERRASLDKVRAEPEALIAPVDGVIADGNPVSGQIVASSAVVFHIVEPSRLWVEALSFEAVNGAVGASANTAGGRALKLSYRGSGFADRSQSIPVHFAIADDTSGLRAGQFVTVLVGTSDESKGVAIPRSSLVRAANGQDFVYEHVAAEKFEPRAVRVEPLDGTHVLISAGIGAGKRVVTQGAELLHHVR